MFRVLMRINRFLAAAGLGSRRSCEELILGGKVTVNGQLCLNLATEVGEEDFVKFGSRRVQPELPQYILLHKPRGYLCTATDTHERKTIFELLPGKWPRLFHVGRLDRDSEGLLILTNDGDLALRLTHPRFKMDKEYEVLLDKPYNAETDTPKMLKGINIEGGRAKAETVKQISPMVLRIVLRQGIKRQIRLMLYKLGYEVERLIRVRIGPLRLAELRVGEWRALTVPEVKGLLTPKEPIPKKAEAVPSKAAPGSRPGSKEKRPRSASTPSRERKGSRARGFRDRGAAKPVSKGRTRGSAASAPKAGRRP